MQCMSCRNEVAATAEVCPYCGARPPHGGAQAHDGLVKILGTILALAVLGKLFGVW